MDVLMEALPEYRDFLLAEWSTLALIAVVMLVWFASGCLAATLAEIRQRSPWAHFAIGMALPIVYPLAALFLLSVKVPKQRREKEEKLDHQEGAPPIEQAPRVDEAEAMASSPLADETGQVFNDAFFKQIASDAEGNPNGPFLMMIQGEEVRVERILDCMPTVVVIEVFDAESKSQTIRVPYTRIESCVEL